LDSLRRKLCLPPTRQYIGGKFCCHFWTLCAFFFAATPAIIPFVVAPTAHPPCLAARKTLRAANQEAAAKAPEGILSLRSPNRLWRTRRKSALFPHCCRIDASFSFLSSMRSCNLLRPRKKCVVDKCHKSFFYSHSISR